jgi:hypothetical protein
MSASRFISRRPLALSRDLTGQLPLFFKLAAQEAHLLILKGEQLLLDDHSLFEDPHLGLQIGGAFDPDEFGRSGLRGPLPLRSGPSGDRSHCQHHKDDESDTYSSL